MGNENSYVCLTEVGWPPFARRLSLAPSGPVGNKRLDWKSEVVAFSLQGELGQLRVFRMRKSKGVTRQLETKERKSYVLAGSPGAGELPVD